MGLSVRFTVCSASYDKLDFLDQPQIHLETSIHPSVPIRATHREQVVYHMDKTY